MKVHKPAAESSAKYKLEKGVPAPKEKEQQRAKYPLRVMDVGDSFFAPVETEAELYRIQRNIKAAIWHVRQFTGHRFTCEVTDAGIRVWRIE